MATDPLSRPVDAVAAKTGLTRDAVAILFIVAGILVLVWEDLLQIILGILLIVVGVVWLVTSWQARQRAGSPPPP
jgi:multisubunit Na+/H+ antiporter MnhC subunit